MEFATCVSRSLVHVVDDDDECRKGLARVINASGLRAVEYRSAGEYLSVGQPDRQDAYDANCLLLDLYLQDSDGLALLGKLTSQQCAPPVVFISGFGDIRTSVSAMRAGALDFLTKPVKAERLLAAVRRAIQEDMARRSRRKQNQEQRIRFALLTEQERIVFYGLVNGKLNKQIAADLDMCERTVKTYRANVMKKMRAQSLPDLVLAARALGLFEQLVYSL